MLLHSAASVHGDNGEVEKKKKYNRKRPTLPNSPRYNDSISGDIFFNNLICLNLLIFSHLCPYLMDRFI